MPKPTKEPKIRILTSLGLLFITLVVIVLPVTGQENTTCEQVTVHYHRNNADYDGWGLHLWGSAVAANVATTWQTTIDQLSGGELALLRLLRCPLQLLLQGIEILLAHFLVATLRRVVLFGLPLLIRRALRALFSRLIF